METFWYYKFPLVVVVALNLPYFAENKQNNWYPNFNFDDEDSQVQGSGSGLSPPPRILTMTTRMPVLTTTRRPRPKWQPWFPTDDEDAKEGSGSMAPMEGSGSGSSMLPPSSSTTTTSYTHLNTSAPSRTTPSRPGPPPVATPILPGNEVTAPLPASNDSVPYFSEAPGPQASILMEIQFLDFTFSEYMVLRNASDPRWLGLSRQLVSAVESTLSDVPGRRTVELLSMRPTMPSVAAAIKVTQLGVTEVAPAVPLTLVVAGNMGLMGTLRVYATIEVLNRSCALGEVYCSTFSCLRGNYCDSKADCPATRADEPPSCPTCFGSALTIVPPEVEVDEGETTEVHCISQPACPSLLWERGPKTPQGHALAVVLSRSSVLRLEEVKSADAGIYFCVARPDKKVKVLVKVNSAPAVQLHPVSHLKLVAGVNQSIWCNSTGGRAEWRASNGTLPLFVEQKRDGDSRVQLLFGLARMDMAGLYFCEVMWGKNKDRKVTVTLIVESPCNPNTHKQCAGDDSCYLKEQWCDGLPQCSDQSDEKGCPECPRGSLQVDKATVELDVGGSDLISCLAPPTCKPVVWRRIDGKPLGPRVQVLGESLFLTAVQPEDSSIYQCSAAGGAVVNTVLQVHSEPTLNVVPPTTPLELIYGETKKLLCTSSSKNVRWVFLGGQFWPRGVRKVQVSEESAELVFTDASPDMAGQYECLVPWGVSFGKKKSVKILVKVRPVECTSEDDRRCSDGKKCIPKSRWCDGVPQCDDRSDEQACPKCHNGFVVANPRKLELTEGDSRQVTCWAPEQCRPVKWKRFNNEALSERVRVADSRLFFTNLTTTDSGLYYCYSGDKSSTVNVTVHKAVQLTLTDSQGILSFEFGSSRGTTCHSNVGTPKWRRADAKPLTTGGFVYEQVVESGSTILQFHYGIFKASGVYECYVRLDPQGPETVLPLMVYVQPVRCNPLSEKRCADLKRCVSAHKWCDGKNDCLDGSDEKDCSRCMGHLMVYPQEHSVGEEALVVFNCYVSSTKCLPIVWQRRDGRPFDPRRWIQQKESLVLISTKKEDSGEIICRHGNKQASAFLSVISVTLKLNLTTEELVLPEGGSQVVSCSSARGQPLWVPPRDRDVWQYGVQFTPPVNGEMSIAFEDVRREAAGVYECHMRTASGINAIASFKLTITTNRKRRSP